MAMKKDTLDQLLEGRDPQAAFSQDLKKAPAERVLNAKLADHLESDAMEGRVNRHNGYSTTVLTENAKIDVRIPRDWEGTFDPKLIQRYQRRVRGFDDKIVSMYARAMSVREIQGHLTELYGIDVWPDLISTVTDSVLETVAEWQNRPLEASDPLGSRQLVERRPFWPVVGQAEALILSRFACPALAAPGGIVPERITATWVTVSKAWWLSDSGVNPPTCGVAITSCRAARRGDGIWNGAMPTSSAAPAMMPWSSACSSAVSSTRSPRETLTRNAVRFMRASASALIRFRVSGVATASGTTKSASARSAGRVTCSTARPAGTS
jgi:Transposase, Mutator family